MKKALSAGGIVIRKREGKVQVILVEYSHTYGFTFPKGHVEESEEIENAALREVEEETGMSGFVIIKKLGVVTREATDREGIPEMKDIHLFLMNGENLVGSSEPEENCEWYEVDKALELISHKEEVEFFKSILGEVSSY